MPVESTVPTQKADADSELVKAPLADLPVV